MSVFMLECESVSEVGSSLSSLVSKISEISSSVNGYDTSCEDGFDFASAKSSTHTSLPISFSYSWLTSSLQGFLFQHLKLSPLPCLPTQPLCSS